MAMVYHRTWIVKLNKEMSWRVSWRVFVENFYFFGSSFPAKRIPNVNVTSTESTNAMNPVASLATGKYPFLRAD